MMGLRIRQRIKYLANNLVSATEHMSYHDHWNSLLWHFWQQTPNLKHICVCTICPRQSPNDWAVQGILSCTAAFMLCYLKCSIISLSDQVSIIFIIYKGSAYKGKKPQHKIWGIQGLNLKEYRAVPNLRLLRFSISSDTSTKFSRRQTERCWQITFHCSFDVLHLSKPWQMVQWQQDCSPWHQKQGFSY